MIFASPDDLPPKIYHEKGELKGTYVEIIQEVCKRLQIEAEFQQFPWARAMAMVKSGQADALFPPLKTKDREEFLYFPSVPLSITKNVVFARKSRNIVIHTADDLKNYVLGVNDQYSYGPEFEKYKKTLKLDTSLNEEMQINKLARDGMKRIDLAAASEEAFLFMSKRMGFSDQFEVVYVISESPSYVAFSKSKGDEAKAFADKFSKTLKHLKKEGFVQKIFDKYLK